MNDKYQMDFFEAKKILAGYSIHLPDLLVIKNEDDLETSAEKIGFPQAMKIISKDVIHKTDSGGVVTGINNIDEANVAYKAILENIKKDNSNAKIDGVLVQKMATGVEIIMGIKRDLQFGPVILFGLGGIFVEIIKDVAMRVAPITNDDALSMIDEIKGEPMLSGARGMKPADKNKLAEMLVNLSRLALKEDNIEEIDLNPVFVNGKDIEIVDVRIIAND